MSKISLFPEGQISKHSGKLSPSSIPFTNIEFDEYLEHVRDGSYQDEVLEYRTGKREKLKLRGVTPSGVFTYRNAKSLLVHSGFISIDIDDKDQPRKDYDVIKDEIKKDPYTYSVHSSVSGRGGLVVYFKIVPEKHLEAFFAIEKYFSDTYNVIIDKSCKDVSRFRFVSYDPELYVNKKSRTWKTYLNKKQIEPKVTYIHTNNDIDHILQQISDRGIDLTNSYDDWFKIGAGMVHKYGDSGRDYFHLISQNSAKYSQKVVDDLYDILLKRSADKIATIGTFLWLCKGAGIEIKTQRTEKIERIGKTRLKTVGASGGAKDKAEAIQSAKKYLEEMEGITGSDVDEVLNIVSELPQHELNIKSNDVLADLKAFLNTFEIKFNEITRNYEMKGEPMCDRDYNSIYIKALEQVDEKITKDKIFSLIDSENTPSYHPFKTFFSKYKHLRPSGNFEKLCKCIEYQQVTYVDGKRVIVTDYLEIFLKKWLLGIISSMHGTYSLLILVFAGGQGNGKTKFFRGLLPDELTHFYAESKLDRDKDDEILMTKKLLIMDDEFGGKSKQDAKKLKELSSKQWFNIRKPFGRSHEDLRRLAVLCGTSNDDEIINDPTGNRRIIPVNVINVNTEMLDEIDKVDLFMELYWEWRETGDKWMLTKDEIEILNNCTQLNEQPSPEEELIIKYFSPVESLGGNCSAMTNTEIKSYIEQKNPTIRVNTYKLGLVLKKLGFEKRNKRFGGFPKMVYFVEILQ